MSFRGIACDNQRETFSGDDTQTEMQRNMKTVPICSRERKELQIVT